MFKFKKKDTKTAKQSKKAQTRKSAVKSGKAQTSKTTAKSEVTQDRSDAVLAKLKAIENEMSLEQARDRVDQLEDEKIAANIEQLLKIIRSGE